jgi:hypothetical protein
MIDIGIGLVFFAIVAVLYVLAMRQVWRRPETYYFEVQDREPT